MCGCFPRGSAHRRRKTRWSTVSCGGAEKDERLSVVCPDLERLLTNLAQSRPGTRVPGAVAQFWLWESESWSPPPADANLAVAGDHHTLLAIEEPRKVGRARRCGAARDRDEQRDDDDPLSGPGEPFRPRPGVSYTEQTKPHSRSPRRPSRSPPRPVDLAGRIAHHERWWGHRTTVRSRRRAAMNSADRE